MWNLFAGSVKQHQGFRKYTIMRVTNYLRIRPAVRPGRLVPVSTSNKKKKKNTLVNKRVTINIKIIIYIVCVLGVKKWNSVTYMLHV